MKRFLVGRLLALSDGRVDLHRADKHQRVGHALLVHLDAELGAEVGDGGGGSLDSE